MEPLPDEVILAKVVARLQQAYPAANTTSKLVGYVIPKWYTNDLFGGSYTNYPVRGAAGWCRGTTNWSAPRIIRLFTLRARGREQAEQAGPPAWGGASSAPRLQQALKRGPARPPMRRPASTTPRGLPWSRPWARLAT